MAKTKIIRNAIRCNTCGKICESTHVHDFVACDCPYGSATWCAADGGKDYLRRVGNTGSYEELSEYEVVE